MLLRFAFDFVYVWDFVECFFFFFVSLERGRVTIAFSLGTVGLATSFRKEL